MHITTCTRNTEVGILVYINSQMYFMHVPKFPVRSITVFHPKRNLNTHVHSMGIMGRINVQHNPSC